MSDPDKKVFDKLASDVGSWKSIEVRVREDFACDDPVVAKKMTFHSTEQHYTETAKGQRSLRQVSIEGSKVVYRSNFFCDGSRCADAGYDQDDPDLQQFVIIKRSFYLEGKSEGVDRPVPLLYLFVGKRQLGKSAASALYSGPENILGRKCDDWLFEQVKWPVPQDQIFTLDQETGIPLKVTSFLNAEHRTQNKPLFSWVADTLDTVNGHAIVRKSHQVDYNPGLPAASSDSPASPSGLPATLFARKFVVQSVEFNKDYPASTFWPVIEPGVRVFDSITGKDYVQPGRRREVDRKAEPANTAMPIVATLPQDWSTKMANASLILGLLVLVVGAYLWFKNKRSTNSNSV